MIKPKKKKYYPIRRKKYIYKRKPTGERELFLKIWEEREHYCTNCKTFLGHAPMAHYFSHIIPKSRDASKRLDPDNIQLLCVVCHYTHDFRGKEKFEERQKTI